MQVDDVSGQEFAEDILRGHGGRIISTKDGLVLGDALLAKMGHDGLCIDGEEERILTLLAIGYRSDLPDTGRWQ
jgi:hypothetical protein